MSSRRFPHPLTLLVGCILAAAVLTWVVPAGEYERRQDAVTERMVVVSGTYQSVPANPLGPLEMLLSIPRGIADAVSVIAVVFLVGGAFSVVDRTGALRVALSGLVRRLRDREVLAIPICCIAFAAGGALENMQEEIIALVPVLILLTSRLGFDDVTAVAISVGAAAVGSAFSPVNPFQVGIAQQVADVPLFSGGLFRTVVLLLALGLWIAGTLRYAKRAGSRARAAEMTPVHTGGAAPGGTEADTASSASAQGDAAATPLGKGRTMVIMALVAATFAVFILGLARLGWGFDELAAVFLVMGVAAGLIGGLGLNGTAEAYVGGFRDMAFAALLIGFARAIYVVLNEGRIIDTIVHGLFTPLAGMPDAVAAVGMMAVHTLVHVPVPSVSGQAVLTMPILVPLSDLLGIARQVTILAYQYGAGLCELLTPTNGALMAVLAAAGVRYDRWLRFVLPMWGMLALLGVAAILAAMALGVT